MSWVTDVLLTTDTREVWREDEDDIEDDKLIQIQILAIVNINQWLKKKGYKGLINLSDHVSRSSSKAMQALVYGGAFNYLDEEEFLSVVQQQSWHVPKNVQLLMKSEMEEIFTLYMLKEDAETKTVRLIPITLN